MRIVNGLKNFPIRRAMQFEIRLFAACKERLGRGVTQVELPAGATVGGLRAAIAAQHPELAPLLPHSLVAVNAEYASDGRVLGARDELALIPPVSGG